MSCCGICGRSEFHLLPPVSRPPSHSPPLFPVGWVVSLQPFISIHKEPNIAPFFTSFSPPVVSSEIVPSWVTCTSANPNLTVVQSAGRSALTLKLVEKLSDSTEIAKNLDQETLGMTHRCSPLLSWWHVFPPSAVIFDFLADIIKFSP